MARPEIIIDAKDAVVGRLSSFAAKKALQGNKIIVVNSQAALFLGNPKKMIEDFSKKRQLGHGVQKGPFISRKPSIILRRAIRGMLAFKTSHGREAFKHVICHEHVPKEYESREKIAMPSSSIQKSITLGELSKRLGG